jgi:vacuolar iron transporter family protein
MAKDALTAHARDELGISEITTARPVQAALTSAVTFSTGAAMPLLMVVVSPPVCSFQSCPRRLWDFLHF